MDRQKAFEKVWNALQTQGKQSYGSLDGLGQCMFRADDRDAEGRVVRVLKCAIGHLIPDDKYTRELEELSISELIVAEVIEGDPTQDDAAFLQSLQQSHDGADDESAFWHDCATDLLDVAQQYNLKTPSFSYAD